MTQQTILFVQGAAERAGAEAILLALLRHLDRDAFRPVVAFLARGPFVHEVAQEGVEVVELAPAGRLRDVGRARGTIAAVAGAIRSSGAEVVQATGEVMSVYGGWAARQAGRPSVAWLHDSPAGRDPAAWLAQVALRASPRSATIACARWLADAFNRRLRLGATAIQNGIELERLPSDGASGRRTTLTLAGWPDDAVIVGHFARLERWKGTDVFLRAAAQVAARRPAARFLVVGGALYGRDEEYAAGLPALAASLGLDGRVHFAGYRTDARELMAGSDVVAHCSVRPDPFPTVVIEALALGRAVVATRSRGPEEQVDDGRTGALVAPRDAAALADDIDRFVADADRRRRFGAAAAEDAHRRFAARRMAAEFEDLWRRLAAGGA